MAQIGKLRCFRDIRGAGARYCAGLARVAYKYTRAPDGLCLVFPEHSLPAPACLAPHCLSPLALRLGTSTYLRSQFFFDRYLCSFHTVHPLSHAPSPTWVLHSLSLSLSLPTANPPYERWTERAPETWTLSGACSTFSEITRC